MPPLSIDGEVVDVHFHSDGSAVLVMADGSEVVLSARIMESLESCFA